MTAYPIDSLAVPGVDALVAGYARGTLRPSARSPSRTARP
jgi:hypothetical protein